jgi:poly-gamma-glutamate capsule biosynthesis protein CapA/YwtB (metallophosphatase superfamily)
MKRHVTPLVAGALAALSLVGAPAQAQSGRAAPAGAAPFSMVLSGDMLITRPLAIYREPSFLKLIDLVRGADVAFTNLEMLFHDFEPYPMNESGGTYMRAEPAIVKDVAWAGFDIVARANNHTGDYGVEGMRLTTKYTAEAGLVQAGVGESLPEAREAKYFETPKGRVALISVSSTFPDHSRASRSRGDIPARPGLSPLRFTTKYVVTRERLEALRGAAKDLGQPVPAQGDELTAFGRRFMVGDKAETLTEPLKEDLDEILAVVRNASRLADYTIVTIHSHEVDRTRDMPARFLETFARASIDAGATVFVGHGPHILRGIEIYKSRPIFYSLGDFVFQNETVLRAPSENYDQVALGLDAGVADFNDKRFDNDRKGFPADREIWESVVPKLEWQGGSLASITLTPISLGYGKSRLERGRPMLADQELGRKIIDDIVKRSASWGTKVTFENGVGRVVLPAGASR